jgi:hypothetical protein
MPAAWPETGFGAVLLGATGFRKLTAEYLRAAAIRLATCCPLRSEGERVLHEVDSIISA